MRHTITALIIASLATVVFTLAAAGPSSTADFNKDVRPILSQHCFKCHGPDDRQRQAGLRLDLRAGATAKLATGHVAVTPGRADRSELVRRIDAPGAAIMPPASANKPMTGAERAILKRWIAEGAVYRPHWAFVRPTQAPLPAVRHAAWPRNPIDRFVLSRIERAGLAPSPEADRYTLIRRVSLDLIGLPPTPEEAEAFAHDRRPDAYERLVDRLLASPHYGERWARRWLDLARYADTNGYEKDRQRSIWPYRDWVIRALNADMTFDQFTIKQIAGDMLPNATQDDRIATGFHRNTMLNEEGGIDPLEFRFYNMVDRINTTGTAWLGLTVGCAQCHTHKFDPITQREYYRLMAFLDNADEPTIDVRTPQIEAQRQKREAEIAAREAGLATKFPAADGLTGAANLERQFAAWRAPLEAKAVRWQTLRPAKATSNLPLLTVLDDSSVLASGDMTKRDVYDVDFAAGASGIRAIRLEVLPDDRLPGHGPGRTYYEGPIGDFFLSEITLTVDGKPVKFVRATQSINPEPGAKAAIDGDPQTGWTIGGGQGRAHTAVFVAAEPVSGPFSVHLLFERYHAASLGRFRISATTDARAGETALPVDVEEALVTPPNERTAARDATLRRYYLSQAPELAAERAAIAKLREELPAYPTTLVMEERPANNPRTTYVHRRGEFLQPAETAPPGVLAVLNPRPTGTAANRLTFARWLVSAENPLTARVTMNRQWAAFFGRGIVRTLEDFGYQGAPPTHPELLDWLAIEFMRQGWSLKKMHRLIVTSATYRQSSRVTPTLKQHDPENVLLARGPRVRLEAELVRDAALAASGLLSAKIGGPSVFPPQPAGVTSEGTYGPLAWTTSAGEDRYRRGLYTFSKRTAPYAMFATFDGPSGEACVARREVTNTPLQALAMLNDQVLLETAQALGKLITARPGDTASRAAYLFRRCATRPPTAAERSELARYYEAQYRRFAARELNAEQIAGPGSGDLCERAAWTATARAVLNLDEVVARR